MIILAIITTLAAVAWTFIVLFANGMSDAPMEGFKGGFSIWAAWIGVVVLWLAWWFG